MRILPYLAALGVAVCALGPAMSQDQPAQTAPQAAEGVCPSPPAEPVVDFGEFQPLTVVSAGEEIAAFQVRLADEPVERQRGYMFVPQVPADEGLLFDFEFDAPQGMWMRNTCASLDMLFVESDGVIAGIAHRTVPLSDRVSRSPGPVRAVLEIAGGRAVELGIMPGHRLVHPLFAQADAAAEGGVDPASDIEPDTDPETSEGG